MANVSRGNTRKRSSRKSIDRSAKMSRKPMPEPAGKRRTTLRVAVRIKAESIAAVAVARRAKQIETDKVFFKLKRKLRRRPVDTTLDNYSYAINRKFFSISPPPPRFRSGRFFSRTTVVSSVSPSGRGADTYRRSINTCIRTIVTRIVNLD